MYFATHLGFLAILSATLSGATPLPQDKYGCPPGDTNPECADSTLTFTSLALRSASPIHLTPLTARNGRIYVGGKTESFCPKNVKNCPKGNETMFTIDSVEAIAGMAVVVPGGQQLYVAPNGALRYTPPHTTSKPTGSYTSGFGYFENTKGDVDTWNFTGAGGATGFLACKTQSGEYQVFSNVKGFNQKGCLGFSASYSSAKAPGAYEYA